MFLKGDILVPDGIRESSVLEIGIDGRIADIGVPTSGQEIVDFSGHVIVPGFIDIHVHGGGGADFMDGTVEAVRQVARTHVCYGTTSLLATTLTASRQDIDKAIAAIIEVMNDPGDNEATIVGIHLEGPYICAERRGAQPLSSIRHPDINELAHWIDISRGAVKKITLAPELPGADELIRWAVAHGVIVSIGHTNAVCSQTDDSIAAGATQATHLFNAMSAMTHRAPGAVGALLASDSVNCELICDGVHLAPEVVKVAIRAKGVDRIILITDAMSGAAMPDGNYELGGQTVIVKSGTAKFPDGTLAGSVLTMNEAFANVIEYGCVSDNEASIMTSANAARAFGLSDLKGRIERGTDADLTVIDRHTHKILATVRSGKFVFRQT